MSSKYKVILQGRVLPEFDRQEVLEGLAQMFNSKTANMEKLLNGTRVPLKKQYQKDKATLICQKINALGAACQIEIMDEQTLLLASQGRVSRISVYFGILLRFLYNNY